MAEANRTVKGKRIIVELPFKGATDDKPQYVWMKDNVARFLRFEIKQATDLAYTLQLRKKDEPNQEVSGTTTVRRLRRPGYKQRAFTVVFDSPKTPPNNQKSFKSVSFPVTKSVSVYDVVTYFETGKGSNLGVIKLITDEGASHPITSAS